MKRMVLPIKAVFTLSLFSILFFTAQSQTFSPSKIRMFWLDKDGVPYKTFDHLRKAHPKLRFIMNAGMFTTDHRPVGLYIENGKQLRKMKIVKKGSSNYAIQPQGIFAIYQNKADILIAPASTTGIIYATQSAPMLVINGKINPNLPRGREITRNGVGIKKNGDVFFALEVMDFRAFANHFIKNGCTAALYLDGGVSEVWRKGQPSWELGQFGPMIGAY